jgi:hypothetical protein
VDVRECVDVLDMTAPAEVDGPDRVQDEPVHGRLVRLEDHRDHPELDAVDDGALASPDVKDVDLLVVWTGDRFQRSCDLGQIPLRSLHGRLDDLMRHASPS